MKKSLSVMWASVVVASLSLTAAGAFACDGHDKASTETSSSIEKVSDSGSCSAATKASMTGGTCSMKSSMASLQKAAPGTKMTYAKVDGGIALIVTASSKEYVPVVQQAIATRLDDMKVMTAHAGMTTKVSSGSSCCAGKASAASMTSGASCATTTSATKVSDGAGCTSSATKVSSTSSASAHCTGGAATTQASMESCPDWMKVLCTANCTVENTATGVKVIWTTPEKNKVEQVQMAGEQLHADLAS